MVLLDDEKVSSRVVIVDSCIAQLAGDKNKAKSLAVIEHLKKLHNNEFVLAISEITIFENLHGLWGKKAESAGKMLANFEWKEITREILTMASMFGGLYLQDGVQKSQVSQADKLIASTAFLLNGLILTTDHRDFPSPFFHQFDWQPISYSNDHHTRTIDLVLYEPNISLISRWIEENEKKGVVQLSQA